MSFCFTVLIMKMQSCIIIVLTAFCDWYHLQDEYSRLSRNASLGVHGYVLVFSIVSRQSFDRIVQVNEALLNALGDAPDVPRVLVGSMHDLSDQRQVSQQVRETTMKTACFLVGHVSFNANAKLLFVCRALKSLQILGEFHILSARAKPAKM